MGETRSALWNDSGLALNLDGTKIDQDNLDGERKHKRTSMGHFERNASWDETQVWSFPGWMYKEHGFLCGENHDGTGKDYLVETRLRFNPNLKGRYLAERGSGFTLILRGTTIQNLRVKKPWWDNKCIAEARFRFNPWPEWEMMRNLRMKKPWWD